MAEIYTKSVIQIGNETFRNLPAQVERDQEVSYDANLKSQQAISTATDAKAKATEAKAVADAAQTTANAAQAKANEAKTAADTAQSTADAAQAAANTAQSTADAAQTAANTAQSTADSATELATQVQGELADALGSKVVRYDETQLLSEDQMLTARGNIEAAPITGTVRYDITQHLTDEQKTKAKTNIGVNTDIDTINDTLENKVVRADKKQNLSTDYQSNARENINVMSSPIVQQNIANSVESHSVLFNEYYVGHTQTLTDAQQQKVRTAISAPNDADVVKVTPQTLTDEQKAQARANIGAGTGGGGGGGSTDGAVLYNQAQTLTDQQKSQARTNIDAAPANIDCVKYNSNQTLSDTQKEQACKNINAAPGFVKTTTNTPNINAIETKTVDDYTVLEYIFDARYDAQNRYTTNYDMTLFVIHNNQSLSSSNITATLYEGYVTASGNVTYDKVAEISVPGANKTFAIGCFRNYAYKLVQPVYSINATNLNCQVALGIANFNITESSPNTSYATPSPAAFDLIRRGPNNRINYKLVFSGINDDTTISRFGGFYNEYPY